ncbi:hypothetical protein MMC10_006713 [Thelotrema lepadinum]|nr:hypothetical protein [Thelotrema lepadinum]
MAPYLTSPHLITQSPPLILPPPNTILPPSSFPRRSRSRPLPDHLPQIPWAKMVGAHPPSLVVATLLGAHAIASIWIDVRWVRRGGREEWDGVRRGVG